MALQRPLDEVAVGNLALSILKEEKVQQIDPPTTTPESIIALWYHQIRRECLNAHTWNHAKRRVQLTPETTKTPLFGYTHAYQLPNDFIRYIGRFDAIGQFITSSALTLDFNNRDYDIEDRFYLFNGEDNSAINIRYIYDHTNITNWPPKFLRWVAHELAIAIAGHFVGGNKALKNLLARRDILQQEAQSLNGQQVPPMRKQTSRLLRARHIGTSGIAGRFTRFGGN